MQTFIVPGPSRASVSLEGQIYWKQQQAVSHYALFISLEIVGSCEDMTSFVYFGNEIIAILIWIDFRCQCCILMRVVVGPAAQE